VIKRTSCFTFALLKNHWKFRKEIQRLTQFIAATNAQNNLRRRATRSSEGNVATAARETGGLGFIAKSVLYLVCLNTRKLYLRASFSPRPASCRDTSWTCLWSNRLYRLYFEPQYDSAQNSAGCNELYHIARNISRRISLRRFVRATLSSSYCSWEQTAHLSRDIIPLNFVKGKGTHVSLYKLFKPDRDRRSYPYNYSRWNDLWNSRSALRGPLWFRMTK